MALKPYAVERGITNNDHCQAEHQAHTQAGPDEDRMLSQVSKVEAEFRNLPGVEDSITAIVTALGCPKSQAVTLCKFGYRSVEDVLNSQESEILSVKRHQKLTPRRHEN